MNVVIAPTPRNRARAELELRKRKLLTNSHVDSNHYREVNSIDFAEFKRRVYPPYVETSYQPLLDKYLSQVELYVRTGGAEGIGRLMIFMPPRHSKTLNASKLFPAWFVGRNPDKRLITASYGATLASRNSRSVRNIVRSDAYQEMFPGIKLAQDTASAHEWDIAGHEGGMIAAGVGGGITGHGAHLFIIDDPIKSRSEAESQLYRDNLVQWYGDAYTRLEEPGGAVILMHTRWHEEDLAGYLLQEGIDNWTVLSLPAIADARDELGREAGQALWPERYSLEVLDKIRETLGEYRFVSEYQQRPGPKTGGLFETQSIEVIDHEPECTKIVRFYDLAVTKKATSDFTAGAKIGVTRDERPVLFDMFRRQLTAPEVQEAIVQNALIDGTNVPIYLEGEKAGIVQLDYLLRDPRLRGFKISTIPPLGDKYTRAGPLASRVNAGKMLMVRAAWNRAYLDELAVFPHGGHDDQVDCSSGGWGVLASRRKATFA